MPKKTTDKSKNTNLSRRKFIQATSIATSSSLVSGSLLSAERPVSAPKKRKSISGTDVDVIVIGAGLAGLTAARELSHEGYSVRILEARNRLGGRVFTSKLGDHKVELGAHWTFWGNPHMFAEITRYGLELEPELGTTQATDVYWLADGEVKHADFAALDAAWRAPLERFYADAVSVFPNPYENVATDSFRKLDLMSVKDRLDTMDFTVEERNLVSSFVGAACNNFTDKCSWTEALHWFRLHGSYQGYGDAMAYKLKGGLNKLVDAIAEDAESQIDLGTRVSKVTQRKEKVAVETDSGETISCGAVVVTIPVNTLGDIEFSPKLRPEKRAMAKEHHAGKGLSFYARIAGPQPTLLAFGSDSTPLTAILTVHQDKDSSLITGFGPSTELLDVNDDEELQKAIRLWLPDAEVLESYSYDWNVDPFSQGTWCVYKPGQVSKYLSGLQATEGRVFFASGDTAKGFRGFLDGAVESGLRAGRGVAKFLG